MITRGAGGTQDSLISPSQETKSKFATVPMASNYTGPAAAYARTTNMSTVY